MFFELWMVILITIEARGGDTKRLEPTTPKVTAVRQPLFTLKRPPEIEINAPDLLRTRYGSCSYEEIMIASQKCESLFFKGLMEDNCRSCSSQYKSLQQCVSRKWLSCNTAQKMTSLATLPDNRFVQNSEAAYCNGGTLALPGSGNQPVLLGGTHESYFSCLESKITHKGVALHPINYCSPDYYTEAKRCLRKFHQMFRQNVTHPGTCVAYLRARTCFNRVQDRYCEYPKFLQVILNVTRDLYRCWNPFCVWQPINRGANTPCGQQAVTRQEYYVIRGIPAGCNRNEAAEVSQWLTLDQVTYRPSIDLQRTRKRTLNRLAARVNKKFVPPGKITTPPTGKAAKNTCTLGVVVLLAGLLTFVLC